MKTTLLTLFTLTSLGLFAQTQTVALNSSDIESITLSSGLVITIDDLRDYLEQHGMIKGRDSSQFGIKIPVDIMMDGGEMGGGR